TPEQLAAVDVRDPAAIRTWLEEAPLARPTAEGVLPLRGAVNALYAERLGRLAEEIGPRLLARDGPLDAIDEAGWSAVRAALSGYHAWRASEPAGLDTSGGIEHLRAVAASEAVGRLRALAAEDAVVH